MFLYQHIGAHQWLAFLLVLAGLILANEITRRYRVVGILTFAVLPVLLTVLVWPHTSAMGESSTGTWFAWVKVYSALMGTLGFMVMRYRPRLMKHKWILLFPPIILAVNILEACVRDLQVGLMRVDGVVDGVYMISGSWNYMNALAGLLNIVTICGWVGIQISRDKSKDMVWPDMLWFWIIAYDLWNFAYVYNCIGDKSFYTGAALLLSCTIPAFFIKKGAWLQHRAATLSLWAMFSLTFPEFGATSRYAVGSTNDPRALFIVSAIALAANVAVFFYQLHRIITLRLNPLTQELYKGTPDSQRILLDNKLTDDTGTSGARAGHVNASVNAGGARAATASHANADANANANADRSDASESETVEVA